MSENRNGEIQLPEGIFHACYVQKTHSNVEQNGWIMGVTINSVSSTRKTAGAEFLHLDSGTASRMFDQVSKTKSTFA